MKNILLILIYLGFIFPSCGEKTKENKSMANRSEFTKEIAFKKQLSNDLKKQGSDNEGDSSDIDTLSIIASFKIGVSHYFNTTDKNNFDFPAFFGENEESLILVNEIDHKLITINKLTGETSSNEKVNQLFSEYDQKFNGFITLVPYKGVYFIGFLGGIICVSSDGHLISHIVLKQNLNQFTVLKDTSLVIFSGVKMLYVRKNSNEPEIYDLNFQVSENAILTQEMLYNGSYGRLTSISYKNIMQGMKPETHNVSSLLSIKYPYLNAVSPDYLIWANTDKGNEFYFLDRETFGKSKSLTIKVNEKILSDNDVTLESENQGVNIVSSNNELLYVLTMRNKEIKVYKLHINL